MQSCAKKPPPSPSSTSSRYHRLESRRARNNHHLIDYYFALPLLLLGQLDCPMSAGRDVPAREAIRDANCNCSQTRHLKREFFVVVVVVFGGGDSLSLFTLAKTLLAAAACRRILQPDKSRALYSCARARCDIYARAQE